MYGSLSPRSLITVTKPFLPTAPATSSFPFLFRGKEISALPIQPLTLPSESETAKTVPHGPPPFIFTVIESSFPLRVLPIMVAAVSILPSAAEQTFDVPCIERISRTISVLSAAITESVPSSSIILTSLPIVFAFPSRKYGSL